MIMHRITVVRRRSARAKLGLDGWTHLTFRVDAAGAVCAIRIEHLDGLEFVRQQAIQAV